MRTFISGYCKTIYSTMLEIKSDLIYTPHILQDIVLFLETLIKIVVELLADSYRRQTIKVNKFYY